VNNAVAVLDIESGQITDILPLGVKDHHLENSGFVSWDWDGSITCKEGGKCSSNGFDPSDQDCPTEGDCENPKTNAKGKINATITGEYGTDLKVGHFVTWPIYGCINRTLWKRIRHLAKPIWSL